MTEFTADGIDRTTTLKVSGLTCGHCVAHVTEELEALKGVKDVSVLLNKGGQSTVTVLSASTTPPWPRPSTRPGTTRSTPSSATTASAEPGHAPSAPEARVPTGGSGRQQTAPDDNGHRRLP